jgi:hypothetical protein
LKILIKQLIQGLKDEEDRDSRRDKSDKEKVEAFRLNMLRMKERIENEKETLGERKKNVEIWKELAKNMKVDMSKYPHLFSPTLKYTCLDRQYAHLSDTLVT